MKILKQILTIVLIIVLLIIALQYLKQQSLKPANNQTTQQEQTVKTPDPINVRTYLNKTEKLIVAIGTQRYANTYKEPKFYGWGFRELNMDLTYTYGLGVDTKKIEILGVNNNGALVIQLPKDGIKLDYLKLDLQQSKINGDSSIAVKGFNPSEVKVQLTKAEDEVEAEILKDKAVFQQSEESLRDTLRGLCNKMGFKEVLFEEDVVAK